MCENALISVPLSNFYTFFVLILIKRCNFALLKVENINIKIESDTEKTGSLSAFCSN